jgi:hypothetical protein
MLNTLIPTATMKRALATVPAILSFLLSIVAPKGLPKDCDNWAVMRVSIATTASNILISIKFRGGNINCNRYSPNP